MEYSIIQALLMFSLLSGVAPSDLENGSSIKKTVVEKGGLKMASTSLQNSPAERFDTLQDYLAYLEEKGKQGRVYYKRVGSDRYLLMLGRGGNRQPAQYFTHNELLQKFGFER